MFQFFQDSKPSLRYGKKDNESYNLVKKSIEQSFENLGGIDKYIDKKEGVIKYFFQVARFMGCQIGDTMSYSRMNDIFSLRYCREVGIQLPTKSPTTPETFEGAIVFEPVLSINKNVIIISLSVFIVLGITIIIY